jgi:Rrf2 family protein
MRLINAGEYAVRCVAFLAAAPAPGPTTRRAVAEGMDIPEIFLGKIAPLLARAGIIEIVRGQRGGLRLARPSRDISLLDVVEAVIGPISLNDCVLHPNACQRSAGCPFHSAWDHASRQLRDTLAGTSFESIDAVGPCTNDLDVKSRRKPAKGNAQWMP